MGENVRTIPIPEFTDKDNLAKRPKVFSKSLFKMKIGDLLLLESDPHSDNFKFKDQSLSLVMCGGKITDIFRDDFIFSFEIDDGSGSISCFHKFKYDRDAVLKNISELPTTAQFLQTTFTANQTRSANDETIFNSTNSDSVVRKLETDTNEAFRTILSWFNEEVVEKQKARNVGDWIHIVGHLLRNDGCHKISVVDFRIVSNADDREDLALEIDYLNRCIY